MEFDRNEFFRQATIRITGTLDLQKSLDRCLELMRRWSPVESITLILYDASVGTMKMIATAPADGRYAPLKSIMALPDYLKKRVDELLEDRRPFSLLINRPADYPLADSHLEQFSEDFPIHVMETSRVVLGLAIEGRTVAILDVSAPGEGQFTEEHRQALFSLNEPFAIAVVNALRHQELQRLHAMLEDDKRFLEEELYHVAGRRIIGEQTGLRNVLEIVDQVAPRNTPVMLFGETGAGKDLIAAAIHQRSARRDGPFIKVNCGAIPETLVDSELFGHEKGAFTGAVALKRGRFERAHGGTIFLDEIGELPAAAQVRLLRVLQNREIERVGGTEVIDVDVRVISATNRNLEEMVRNREFREDLFFRVNIVPIIVPPLRQRKIDIPALVHEFIEKKSLDLRVPRPPQLAPGALARLVEYQWPGNVRELENLVERELILSKGGPLRFAQLAQSPLAAPTANEGADWLPQTLDEVAAIHIRRTLAITKGRVHGKDGAAALLGINASTLRSRMKKLGIRFGRRAREGQR